jgi:hypothetical protein
MSDVPDRHSKTQEFCHKTQIASFPTIPTIPNNNTMTTINKPIAAENYVKYYNSENETHCYDPPKRSRRSRPRKFNLRNHEQLRLQEHGSKDETYGGLNAGSSHTSSSAESLD